MRETACSANHPAPRVSVDGDATEQACSKWVVGKLISDSNQPSFAASQPRGPSCIFENNPKSSRTRTQSMKPSSTEDCSKGLRSASRHPCCNVQREAIKLPLSTEETNQGASGCKVRVSYQLNRWPRYFLRPATLAKVRSVCSANSGKVRYPNSHATCLAFRRRPRFVGEIRAAIAGGSS